jgi:protein phosphatase
MTSPDPGGTSTNSVPERRPLDREIEVYGLTHRGKVRKTNQDHFLIASLRKAMDVHFTSLPSLDRLPLRGDHLAFLGVVADGVGAASGGDEASRLTLEVVTRYIAESMHCYYAAEGYGDQAFFEALQQAALECHSRIVERAAGNRDLGQMATTLTLWLSVWPRSFILQVGDSRSYLFRDGSLRQLTRDQTMAEELIAQGVLTRTGAARTRWSNVLSSSIGGQQTAPVVTRLELAWGDVGLMCTDGLTKHVSDERIAERLRTMRSAKQVCEDLLQDALDDGGTDNVTIIVGRSVQPEGS